MCSYSVRPELSKGKQRHNSGKCLVFPFALSLSKGEQWHLRSPAQVLVFPFALSLSKGEQGIRTETGALVPVGRSCTSGLSKGEHRHLQEPRYSARIPFALSVSKGEQRHLQGPAHVLVSRSP